LITEIFRRGSRLFAKKYVLNLHKSGVGVSHGQCNATPANKTELVTYSSVRKRTGVVISFDTRKTSIGKKGRTKRMK
jgi:hypothetical protein